MIEQRESTVEIKVIRDRHCCVGRGADRRAHVVGHVDAHVWRHRHAVVDTLTAEDAANNAGRGPIKRLGEPDRIAVLATRLRDYLAFPSYPLKSFWWWHDHLGWQAADT